MKPRDMLLSGFQDFLPERMLPRNALITAARTCFERFGFLPQDTPCLERSELLLGKYGPDGEQLIYSFKDHGDRTVSLRYDLTVPLGRIIDAYAGKMTFPYRRYQIGMVWRADRPGKGRFREFMQIDADIVDDDSVMADIEVLNLASYLLDTLGVKVIIRLNCRSILDALVETCRLDEKFGMNLMRTIDKFDKIGKFGVLAELTNRGFTPATINVVDRYLGITGSNADILTGLSELLGEVQSFESGFGRLKTIIDAMDESTLNHNFRIDPTIARGLNYYTGVIFEVGLLENAEFGSVCSGGRYDRLIKHPNGRLLPSIGLSIGIDRLFAAMESVKQLPSVETTTQVFILNFDDQFLVEYLKMAQTLRSAAISVEISSRPMKLAKQMKSANSRHVPLVLLMGPDEINRAQVIIKDMNTGRQVTVAREEVAFTVAEMLSIKVTPKRG